MSRPGLQILKCRKLQGRAAYIVTHVAVRDQHSDPDVGYFRPCPCGCPLSPCPTPEATTVLAPITPRVLSVLEFHKMGQASLPGLLHSTHVWETQHVGGECVLRGGGAVCCVIFHCTELSLLVRLSLASYKGQSWNVEAFTSMSVVTHLINCDAGNRFLSKLALIPYLPTVFLDKVG